jgi:UPF0716 protein FxsA
VKRRHEWLWPVVVVALVAVPIFEVWLLIQVGQEIGLGPTIAILVAEAVLGGWLMKHEGTRAWTALNKALRTGRLPAGELADAALVLVGGVLLMLPGFATDVLGFFFLMPFTRPLARAMLGFLIARKVSGMTLPVMVGRRDSEDLIEGEVVDPDEPRTRDGRTPPLDQGPGTG